MLTCRCCDKTNRQGPDKWDYANSSEKIFDLGTGLAIVEVDGAQVEGNLVERRMTTREGK